MDTEPNLLHAVQPQLLLHHLPDLDDGLGLLGVRQPDGDLVPLATDIDGPASDLVGVLLGVFPDEEEEDLQPVVVQVFAPLPPVEVDQPPTPGGVPGVLPVGEDPLLEEGVVRARGEPAGHLDVVVETPEVLDGVDSHHLALVLLPGATFVVLEEPESPGILKRVFYDLFWTN